MGLQERVQKFFYDETGILSLHTSILQWQSDQGYISPSTTMNWMAIAQDNGIKYRGDLDMQNGFAEGRYEFEPEEDEEG